MKNKNLLPIVLLFAVNNLQPSTLAEGTPSEVVNQQAITITNLEIPKKTAQDVAELCFINELNNKVAELNAKKVKTAENNKEIVNINAAITKHDQEIDAFIAQLQKDDKVKNAAEIKILEARKSDKVTNAVLKKAEAELSITGQAYYYTWYKNRVATIAGLALLVGATGYGIYNWFFASSDEVDQEDDGDIE